jgi:hypothetical protein
MRIIANGFTVDLADGWEDRSTITLIGPTVQGFAINVVITRERVAPGTRVQDYAKQQGALLAAELPTLIVQDERATTLHGARAFQRLHQFTAGDQTLQQAQTFVVGQGEIFAITCTAPTAAFEASLPAFRRITESFRLFSPASINI